MFAVFTSNASICGKRVVLKNADNADTSK